MTDQLPYCIHCGAQQLNAEAKFCHRSGQPIEPVNPGRRQLPPWVGPVLVSALIVVAAAVMFARLPSRGPAASETVSATSAPTAVAGLVTPATTAQSFGVQVTPPTMAVAPMLETPTPRPTETPQPAPTVDNITPEPVRLTRLAWSPDGKVLAVGSETGVYLYDTETWRETRFIPILRSEYGGAYSLAFSFDGESLAALTKYQGLSGLQVWRVADGGFAYELKVTGPFAASPVEALWATFGEGNLRSGTLSLWRTSDGQLVRTIATGPTAPMTMAFSSDGSLIATGPREDSRPAVWRITDGQRVAQLNWEMVDIFNWSYLAFRPNTTMVVASGYQVPKTVLLLWDANSGLVIRQLIDKDELPQWQGVNGVSFTPDGSQLAASIRGEEGKESRVQLWDADGAPGQSWSVAGQPGDISFSPDGRLLATVTGQSIYLYNPSDGSVVRQVVPAWHSGIMPAPTPDVVLPNTPTVTSHAAALNVPADWKAYDSPDGEFSIRYPPYWDIGGWGVKHVVFVPDSYLDFDPESSLIVAIHLTETCAVDAGPDEETKRRLLQTEDENLNLLFGPGRYSERTLIGSGRWTTLIQALYAEFNLTFGSAFSRVVRELRLLVAPAPDHCAIAYLLDEPGDITEQTRLDLAQVVGSIQFKNR